MDQRHQIKVTAAFVSQQMKALRVTYKKAKHISVQGNSAKSLIFRQRWSMWYLNQDSRTKRYINVDGK